MHRHPNWYLDPVVAQQKQAVHLAWIERNLPPGRVPVLLKTDLFEEAHGEDQLLFNLPRQTDLGIGIDVDAATTRAAAARWPRACACFVTSDVRSLPLRSDSVDVVLSNSTLDHFAAEQDIHHAIVELARVLKPGGRLLVTLDNPRNLLYPSLRAFANRSGLSFRLGRTLGQTQLQQALDQAGFDVLSTDWLLHNPRCVSTAMFLGIRRLLGQHADPIIRALLHLFDLAGRLPTRPWTGVFIAACGRKRPASH